MYFKYGNYEHAAGEAQVTFSRARQHSQRGRVAKETRVLRIQGELIASTQSAIRTAALNLEAAYNRSHDAALYHDDGTKSHIYLNAAESLSGVRVVSLEWPKGDRTEYATKRSYAIVLEADYPGSDNLLSFTETLRIIGDGGPRRAVIETLTGPAQEQLTAVQTTVRAVQSGQAVGLFDYPYVPSPLFPRALDRDRIEVSQGSPTFNGQRFTNFPTNWVYHFTSPTPLLGRPHKQ